MNKVKELINEQYKSIKKETRIHYPRNLDLDEDFIAVFQAQVEELREKGMDDKAILVKIKKALDFLMPDSSN
jgi:hypothetical protein